MIDATSVTRRWSFDGGAQRGPAAAGANQLRCHTADAGAFPGAPKNTSQEMSPGRGVAALTCESPLSGAVTPHKLAEIMKNTTKLTLALRAHSIRNLTAAELRASPTAAKRGPFLPPRLHCAADGPALTN
jgi:hypothetical protein